MRLLLDTHALIFLLAAPEELSTAARTQIENPSQEVAFSAANIWEIEIKAKRGKLVPPAADTLRAAQSLGLVEVPITAEHAETAGRLPLHHADPFDRVLIAQAQVEGYLIVTRDRAFEHYLIPTLPC